MQLKPISLHSKNSALLIPMTRVILIEEKEYIAIFQSVIENMEAIPVTLPFLGNISWNGTSDIYRDISDIV